MNRTEIKEAVEGAVRKVTRQPSAPERAKSRVAEARESLHDAADRVRRSGRDLVDGATGSREDGTRKKLVAAVGAVGAAGAAGAYFLRDKIASPGRQEGAVPTPTAQSPVGTEDGNSA